MSYAIEHQSRLEVEECCNCGTLFAMQASLRKRLRETGEWFYCPNGHRQHYTEREIDRLRKFLDAERATSERYRERGDALERRLSAQKAATTRLKNKIQAGVCPCCKRHFTNLERHMKGQHPGYASGPESEE